MPSYLSDAKELEKVRLLPTSDLVFKIKELTHQDIFSTSVVFNGKTRKENDKMCHVFLSFLVFNPITVEGFAALFSCTAVVQASDSMTASI